MKKQGQENFKVWLEEILAYLETFIGIIPEPYKTKLRNELNKIASLFLNTREPRIAIVGRRGAGKSSLINSIFGDQVAQVGDVRAQTGKGKWYLYQKDSRKISFLDTRGIREGTIPQEEVCCATSEEEIKASIDICLPDVILFLIKADEVTAGIDEDLATLKTIKDYTLRKHSYNPPVVGVITQVDKLAPARVTEPPYEDEKKQANINDAVNILAQKTEHLFGDVMEVIPVSAYMEFDDDKQVLYDRRWNIDRLLDFLFDHLPNNAKMELAKAAKIKSIRKKMARTLSCSVATIAGIIGIQPIPVADLPFITGLQIAMIIGIGYISGKEMSRKTALEFLAAMGVNVGAAFLLRETARALVRLIPVVGNFVSGAIAAGATLGLGEAAIAYFIDLKTAEEAKTIFNTKLKEKLLLEH